MLTPQAPPPLFVHFPDQSVGNFAPRCFRVSPTKPLPAGGCYNGALDQNVSPPPKGGKARLSAPLGRPDHLTGGPIAPLPHRPIGMPPRRSAEEERRRKRAQRARGKAAAQAAAAAEAAAAAQERNMDPAVLREQARASQGMARTRRREVAEAPSGDTPEAARRRSAAAVSPLSAALLRELREARMSRDAERERHDAERERHDALMADVVRNLFGALTPRGTHTHMRRYYACAGTDLPISNEQVMTATPCSRRRPAPPRPIPFHCLASRPRIRSRAPPSLRLGELPFSPFRSQGTPPSLIPTPAGRSLQRANLWF